MSKSVRKPGGSLFVSLTRTGQSLLASKILAVSMLFDDWNGKTSSLSLHIHCDDLTPDSPVFLPDSYDTFWLQRSELLSHLQTSALPPSIAAIMIRDFVDLECKGAKHIVSSQPATDIPSLDILMEMHELMPIRRLADGSYLSSRSLALFFEMPKHAREAYPPFTNDPAIDIGLLKRKYEAGVRYLKGLF
jgi:hypothetical protein